MDLHAPLGKTPPSRRRRAAPLAVGAVGAMLLGILGLHLYRADPHGGEPFAVASIPPPAPPKRVEPAPKPLALDPTPTGSVTLPARESSGRLEPDTERFENGVKIVTPGLPNRVASRDAGPLVIDVSKALDNARRKPLSPAPQSMGSTNPSPSGTRPRVAIFVSGVGLRAETAQTIVDTMPPAVSLAFVPYGATFAATVGAARAKGHEILLQLPMQNAQGAALGSHTLSAGAPPAALQADLAWLMGRFDGYVGVTNLLGGPVTRDAAAMTTVLKTVAARGAFYVDDGTSNASVAPSLAASLGVPAVRADVVLDATADPAVVHANLERLVRIAQAKGAAIGMASGFSDHTAEVARFAAALDARGLSLVPVSTIARGDPNLARAR